MLALPAPSARTWSVPAALALLVALFALDLVTGTSPVLIPLYVLGPLLAATGGHARAVAGVGVVAVLLAVARAISLPELDQEAVRVATVALGGLLATWVAALRDRRAEALGTARTQSDRCETLLTALSEVGEGMVVLEANGRCVYANAAFEQISGYTFPELATLDSLIELVAEDQRDEARRRARLRLERGLVEANVELAIRRRDGRPAHIEIAGVPLLAEGREQLVVVVRDVTNRRRAERERERALARSALLAEASEL